HDAAGHGRPAAIGCGPFRPARFRHRHRYSICSTCDPAASAGAGAGAADGGRARNVTASGRRRLRTLVWRAAAGDLRSSRTHRRRPGGRPLIILALTGSIGMGKSTTARMFAEEGVPVHDSDEAVHRLYAGPAAEIIGEAFPGTVVNGVVDRQRLSKLVLDNPQQLRRLGELIHPLVRADADAFVERHRKEGARLVVLDIPLLFETGGTDRVDSILVVTASPEVQKQRVMARPGMTEEKFA